MSDVGALLARSRRRLRMSWAIGTIAWLGPAVAAVALGLVVLGRLRPWAWPELTAGAVGVGFVVVVVGAAVARRMPLPVVARAADRGLETNDALSTALEIGDAVGVLPDRVRSRAEAIASRADVRRAIPLVIPRRRLAGGCGLALAALVVASIANPQDDIARSSAAEQAAIALEAERLADDAASLAEALGDPDEVAALDALAQLAEELLEAESIAEARTMLDELRAELARGIEPEFLATQAAAQGLDASLTAAALPGASNPADAADALDAAADALDDLDPAAAAAMAERLDALASTQAVGSPATSVALAAAAAAVASGDNAAAASALADAASAQRAASASVGAQQAGLLAAELAARASDRLGAGAGSRGPQAQGAGGDGGDGDGDGDGGEGQGNGGGASGAGSGPSGTVGGASGGTGAGQGGQGQSGRSGDDPATGPDSGPDPIVFAPTDVTGASTDELDIGGVATGEPGEVVGRGNGTSQSGSSYIPLSQALASYGEQATAALDRGRLPVSMQRLVQAYFDRLSGG